MSDLDVIDPTFRQNLEGSDPSVVAVADYLRDRWLIVGKPELVCRPSAAERHKFKDKADLIVNGRRWEVKQKLKDNFTCEADFPYADLYVEFVPTFDCKDPVPVWYCIVNRDLTHALLINVRKSFPYWTISKPFFFRGRYQTSYICPKRLVHSWFSLLERPALFQCENTNRDRVSQPNPLETLPLNFQLTLF